MPRMSGRELAERLIEKRPNTKLIFYVGLYRRYPGTKR